MFVQDEIRSDDQHGDVRAEDEEHGSLIKTGKIKVLQGVKVVHVLS